MSIQNYNTAPYYDDYDPMKGFVQILAVAGKAEQSREFTQMGTMYRDFLARLGDAVFKEGTVIDGCSFLVVGKEARIAPGRIYLGGLVRIIAEDVVIPLQGLGIEVIGVKLQSEIITASQDASLRNPAVGTEAAGTEGAHRVKETLVFTNNDPDATTLFRVEGGVIVSDKVYEESTTDVVTEVLARRTYDENGNFKIRGLALTDIGESDEDNVYVGLTEGKAYIEGYEVVKPYQTKIKLPISRDTDEVQNEPKTYINNQPRYKLNNYPARELHEMVVDMRETIELTKGSRDGFDDIPHTPVIEIEHIEGYTQGVDFQLSADRVDWSVPGGKEPATGSTYSITYKYKRTLKIGVDVAIENTVENGEGVSYVVFQEGTMRPINNTQMTIDYDFYLARKDLILLNKNGEVTSLRGMPAKANKAQSPINSDETLITIGSVLLTPDSDVVYIVNQETTRLTQAELYNLKRRIDDLEVSMAMTDLDREAMDGEDATDLKGIFTDGFIGLTKADVTHPEFDCSIDLDMAEMTLPFETAVTELNINSDSAETNIRQMGRVLMAPFTAVPAVTQPYATDSMLVNPYAVYRPVVPVKLIPEVDNWIDVTKIQINKESVKSTSLRRWWYHRGASWAESEKARWEALGFIDGGESLGWSNGSATSTTTTSQVILDEAITYMRPRKVVAHAFNFEPGEYPIECYFNEKRVDLVPVDPELYGEASGRGTMMANGKGEFKAHFMIPGNVPCGQVQVLFKGPISTGEAVYRASGRKQVIEETVLTTKVVVKPVDPLAQSFGFESDTVLTGLDLYFAYKDPNLACCVQVRNMVNGYPGTICYAEEFLSSEDVKVSQDASKATGVEFSQPVYCKANEQYCFVVLTDSNVYKLWYAELGKQDIQSKQTVARQPYDTGVMFSSSNALTWTAHQTSDLKFTLYKANYTGRGNLLFHNVTNVQMSRVLLAAQSVDFKNAGIEWWYRNASTESWRALDTYVAQDLPKQRETFQLKAVLNVAYSTSPIIATDCVNLVSFLDGQDATYVSRTIETEEEFTSIKVLLQLCLPSGCTHHVYYKCEDVSDEWVELNAPSTNKVSSEWMQYEWVKTGIAARKYKIKIVLHTANILVRPRARKLINILKY